VMLTLQDLRMVPHRGVHGEEATVTVWGDCGTTLPGLVVSTAASTLPGICQTVLTVAVHKLRYTFRPIVSP